MKVSTRVEYGVQALADIALYSGTGDVVSAAETSGYSMAISWFMPGLLQSLFRK